MVIRKYTNHLVKREQSQTCLSYAERENGRMKSNIVFKKEAVIRSNSLSCTRTARKTLQKVLWQVSSSPY